MDPDERLAAIQAHAEVFEAARAEEIGFTAWHHARAPRKDGTWRFSVEVPRWKPSKVTKKQAKSSKRLQANRVPIETCLRVLFSTLEGVEVAAIMADSDDHLEIAAESV